VQPKLTRPMLGPIDGMAIADIHGRGRVLAGVVPLRSHFCLLWTDICGKRTFL